eukprot:5032954-Pyramimonas_sp.AAC.1
MYVPGTPEIRPVLLSAGVETVYSIRCAGEKKTIGSAAFRRLLLAEPLPSFSRQPCAAPRRG